MNITHDFALRHMNNIIAEWGCFFTYVKEDPGIHAPKRNISLGGRYSCDTYVKFEEEKIRIEEEEKIRIEGEEKIRIEGEENIRIEEELKAIKQSKIWKFFSLYRKIKDKLIR